MMNLNLSVGSGRALQVLCLGAHSDDIEIGCGGMILHLIQQYPGCTFYWAVFSASGVRKVEAERGAEVFAGPPHLTKTVLKEFPDTVMPYIGAEVKKAFEEIKSSFSPDLILTHNGKDAHQDHRLICELTWNAFRDHFILEYEIPKYDGDLGRPNVFVPLAPELYEKKVQTIVEVFQSQHSKHWFEESAFLSLMRLRGIECNAPSGYAEAFYCRKLLL